jgi:hypothetical protein
MTATPIAQEEQGRGCRLGQPTVGLPPLAQAVTRQCTGVMARPEVDLAMSPLQIIDAVGNHNACGQTRKVRSKRCHGRLGGACARPIPMAHPRFFLVSLLTLGAPRVVYSSLSRTIWANCASRCAHAPVR